MGNAVVRRVRRHRVHEFVHATLGTTRRRGRGRTLPPVSRGLPHAFSKGVSAHGNRGRRDVRSATKPRRVAATVESVRPLGKVQRQSDSWGGPFGRDGERSRAEVQPGH